VSLKIKMERSRFSRQQSLVRCCDTPILLTVNCKKDEDTPDSDSCGTNISFLENGESVSLPIGGLGQGTNAIYELKDPSPFNSNGISRLLAIRGQEGLIGFDISIELDVDNEDDCIPLGVYELNNTDSDGLLLFSYAKGLNFRFASEFDGSGWLEITKCDFENRQISGKFSCMMGQSFNEDDMNITSGEFNNVCFIDIR